MASSIFSSWCYPRVERMKIPKRILIPIIISLVLFIIPFFWFKPGEMDLGGDSSRLYFYDPVSYLVKSALYVISPSSFGFENRNYVTLPFIALLIFLKSIISSPTILISAFYGFSLSMAFIFCYLTIKELINAEKSWRAAVVGALLYVLSPALIDGWKHVLITYNQVFLNPLIFYLLLKYFKTAKLYIIFIIIILTFVFSPNFSIAAAPPFFAFYPLSILFLILYTKLILKNKIIVNHIILGLLLFIGIQAFHIAPQIISVFSKGSDINSTIFSDQGKFDRGLSYFSAIAPNIKTSINLFVLPQMKLLSSFSNVFFIFPFVIVAAFFFNKKKTILLTAFFFLITLFFATANITNIGLSFYKSLFSIPGFSMFRNFGGQWQYMYIFFYSILFGQALYILLDKARNIYVYLFTFSLILILVINAVPLIKGNFVRDDLWQSNNVEAIIRMDPDYEKVLSYIRSLPADGRVLTLPLTDPGYQIVAGENGGAYMGPSTISYLGGKKDFAGYDELIDYKDLILKLVRDNQLETLKRVLGTLNIKYIFYNADPLVYDSFPGFPYQHVRDFLPKDQASYKKFIQELNIREIKNIKNKFFVYELQDNYYLPQINISKKSVYSNDPVTEIKTQLSIQGSDIRTSVFNSGIYPVSPKVKFDERLIDIQKNSSLSNLIMSTNKQNFGFPYASWSTTSLIYPFLISREEKDLASYRSLDQTHIDRSIFLAEKKIAELQKFGNKTLVLGNIKSIDGLNKSWQEPNMLEAIFFQKYNFWEISLLRYQRVLNILIDKIEKTSETDHSFIVYKDRVRKSISADREMLFGIIQSNEKLSESQKVYLFKLSIDMFDSIANRLLFEMPLVDKVTYDLSQLEKGKYGIYIDKNSTQNYSQSSLQAVINNVNFSFKDFQQEGNWLKGQDVAIADSNQSSLSLLLPNPINLASETKWRSVEEGNLSTDAVSMTVKDTRLNDKTGLIKEIANWIPMSYYLISFDYMTYDKSFKLSLFDTLGKKGGVSNILSDQLRSSKWKKYTSIIVSSDNADSAFMQITRVKGNELLEQIGSQEQITKIDIKNLSIIQVPNPKIVLRKVNEENKNIPSITFTRINPAKYEVKVENATSAYTLVLINQFNLNWRLINSAEDTPTIRAFLSRFIADIGKKAVSIFVKENVSNKSMVLSYFNGDVKENVDQDIFLNRKTFETWGKNEIAEYKHFPVNGYANAWYIEPKDLNGNQEYTLIIEMTAQKSFYVYFAISILILIALVTLLMRVFLRNK